jgi:DNA-binding beta-propeller fold protein YncE
LLVADAPSVPAARLAAQTPTRQTPSSINHPAWPAPPAPARIRFLRTLDPAAVRGRPSMFSRLLTVLTGAQAEPKMSQPYGIAVGPDRRIYVADTFGGTIHVYNLEKPDYSSIKVDGRSLIGIGFAANRMFVTDSASGRLLCLDTRGRTQWTLGPKNGFERPTGIAASKDRLYVVDTMKHRVVMVSVTGTIIGSFGTRGGGPGEFNFPTNIARSADGRLFVTDSMNFRVQVFSEDGRLLNTFGRLGDGSGDFDKPKGIAVDSAGHIYVVEGLNDVVQIFDDEGKLLLAFGGSGFGEGQFWLPSGIAIANDVVYVADSANRRVQMFEYLKDSR